MADVNINGRLWIGGEGWVWRVIGMRRGQAPAPGPVSAGARNRPLTWSKQVIKV